MIKWLTGLFKSRSHAVNLPKPFPLIHNNFTKTRPWVNYSEVHDIDAHEFRTVVKMILDFYLSRLNLNEVTTITGGISSIPILQCSSESLNIFHVEKLFDIYCGIITLEGEDGSTCILTNGVDYKMNYESAVSMSLFGNKHQVLWKRIIYDEIRDVLVKYNIKGATYKLSDIGIYGEVDPLHPVTIENEYYHN